MKTFAFLSFLALFAGCRSITVPIVEPWEGRYQSVEEFRKGTEGIQLGEGQSIWVISNGTMYRILEKSERN